MYSSDKRIVMTLDAGGTNFVFSAIQANREIVEPFRRPSHADNLEQCLETLENGFKMVLSQLPSPPIAISFAFPGPADYPNGIIGDLPNFPAFRGGVALGPFLEQKFGIPTYINNDGNLFAYGEAISGALPKVNEQLKAFGCNKRYRNIIGITLGTGFGCGVVINDRLLVGDNSAGGDVWCFRNKKHHDLIVEESVSIRAVKRVYEEVSSDHSQLAPQDIYEIAEGKRPGNQKAAIESFRQMGEMIGDSLAYAATIVDGIIVVGGGLSGASKYIFPAVLDEMNHKIGTFNGDSFCRMQSEVYNLDDNFARFASRDKKTVSIPGSTDTVQYDDVKRLGIISSALGTSRSIALGAYAYALQQTDVIHN